MNKSIQFLILEYVKTLGEKYSLALTLNNTHKKGYHILLTLNVHQKRTLKKDDLPGEFIQVTKLSLTLIYDILNELLFIYIIG